MYEIVLMFIKLGVWLIIVILGMRCFCEDEYPSRNVSKPANQSYTHSDNNEQDEPMTWL